MVKSCCPACTVEPTSTLRLPMIPETGATRFVYERSSSARSTPAFAALACASFACSVARLIATCCGVAIALRETAARFRHLRAALIRRARGRLHSRPIHGYQRRRRIHRRALRLRRRHDLIELRARNLVFFHQRAIALQVSLSLRVVGFRLAHLRLGLGQPLAAPPPYSVPPPPALPVAYPPAPAPLRCWSRSPSP